jgi:curved DNA-binding protein
MATDKRDYYELLEVAKDADAAAIKKAFRKKAQEFHPDKNPGDKQAEDRFKDVNEAYAVLSDETKRRQYDAVGHARFNERFTQEDIFRGADFSSAFEGMPFGADILEALFGRGRAGGGGGFRRGPTKGQDAQLELEVGFVEAALGGERRVRVNRSEGPKDLTVRIPGGVEAGSTIRVRSEGHPGGGGGPAGDLLLRLKVAPHPTLTRDGADVHASVTVQLSTMVLGGTATIPTLDGEKKIKLQPGTPSGAQQRLRGLGAVSREGGRGDLFVKLYPLLPADPSPELRAVFEQLRELGH